MRIYADNAATTALCPEALDAMVNCLKDTYGNPSSLHRMGQEAAEVVLEARTTIANALGAGVNEIYFTSGGTEADNWAITNAARLGEKKAKSTLFPQHSSIMLFFILLQSLKKKVLKLSFSMFTGTVM